MQSRTHKILSAVVVAALGLGSAATYAQPRSDAGSNIGKARPGTGQQSHSGPAAHSKQVQPTQKPSAAKHPQGAPRAQAGHGPGAQGSKGQHGQHATRGAGPNHDWHKGGRVPPEYRTKHYVVNDWRTHRLSAPPRGYHWVQNGGDYLLVAIATGVITSIILNSAY